MKKYIGAYLVVVGSLLLALLIVSFSTLPLALFGATYAAGVCSVVFGVWTLYGEYFDLK